TINFDIAVNNDFWAVTANGSAQQINGAISEAGTDMIRLTMNGDGTGTLVLNGSNTFVADVLVKGSAFELGSSGLLQFEIGESGTNNKVYGDGGTYTDSAEFLGSFVFDLSGAGTTVGDAWTIVDNSDLTVSYDSSFSIDGFTDTGSDLWTKNANGVIYQFDESTGVLSVIPEPVSISLLGLGMGLILFIRRRMK
ncbi:MAG: PEP-CTERM sorting domain-containing protein, partial [Kiritimatiellales bacterium]